MAADQNGQVAAHAISIDHSALARMKGDFAELSSAFANRRELADWQSEVMDGAGEFSHAIEDGALSFFLSFREAFDVCHESSGLIAGNIGATAVDFERLDWHFTSNGI